MNDMKNFIERSLKNAQISLENAKKYHFKYLKNY